MELQSKLKNCDMPSLKHKLKVVSEDIKNLEEELEQREQLLSFIDELINQKRSK